MVVLVPPHPLKRRSNKRISIELNTKKITLRIYFTCQLLEIVTEMYSVSLYISRGGIRLFFGVVQQLFSSLQTCELILRRAVDRLLRWVASGSVEDREAGKRIILAKNKTDASLAFVLISMANPRGDWSLADGSPDKFAEAFTLVWEFTKTRFLFRRWMG